MHKVTYFCNTYNEFQRVTQIGAKLVTFTKDSIDKYSLAKTCGFIRPGVNEPWRRFLHVVCIRSFALNGDIFLGFLERYIRLLLDERKTEKQI